MKEYIKTSLKQGNKMITLDGDMSERSYSCLSRFGDAINIYNMENFNNFTLNILPNDKSVEFKNMIKADIANYQNLFIPSMSNGFAIELNAELLGTPGNIIKLYNKSMSDTEK